MKILFLTNSLGMGGIEINIVRLTRELHQFGHEIVCASRSGSLVASFERAGGRHVPLNVNLGTRQGLNEDADVLRRLLREYCPEVIHVFSASAARILRSARRAFRNPLIQKAAVVSSIMGLKNHPAENPIRTYARAYATCWGSDRILVISPAIGRVVKRLPVGRSRIVEQDVVGVDPDEVRKSAGSANTAPGLNLQANDELVLTVGRLEPSKSHHLFLEAAALVTQRRPTAVFGIVGGGPLLAELESKAKGLGITSRVRFLGERDDVPRLLNASRVVVRPGVVEGFVGITVLEAQALAKPVVAFETEDVRLAIRDGESGLLTPPSDVKALASSIMDLLESPGYAQSIGESGQRAVERFSINTIAKALDARYELEARAQKNVRPASSTGVNVS